MNILTFDIEEWSIAKANGTGNEALYAEYDSYLDRILDKLDERGIKATFFCLGEMASEFPEVVRKIDSRGHEIGCHSNAHLWANKITEDEFREDTRSAIAALEDCIGKKVLSYRAPAFSIGESNLWAFDVLAENGIVRDASVFPAVRDFGGFPGFGFDKPVRIRRNGYEILEFPVSMKRILGRDIAYSGGGYFRLFPEWFVRSEIRRATYCMTYFHLNDIIPGSGKMMDRASYEAYFKNKGTFVNRLKRYFKKNIGRKDALLKLFRLVNGFNFISVEKAAEMEIVGIKEL